MNRTVDGADLRLRSAPTDLEDFKFDFIEDCLRPPVETWLLADDSAEWLSEDRLERRVDVGVVLLLESGGRAPVVVLLRVIMILFGERTEDLLNSTPPSARATHLF